MEYYEKKIDGEVKYEGVIVNVHLDRAELHNGTVVRREVVEHPGGVCVVPLFDDGTVIMEWQYRRPFDTNTYEIPAGELYPGEDPLVCGKRELEEETGYCAKKYTYLGKMLPTPGFCGEIVHMYLAQDIYEGSMNRDEDEFMEIERVPLETLVDKVLTGEIIDAKTCIALLKVNEMRNRGMI